MVAIDLSPAVVDISGVRAGDRNAVRMTLKQGTSPFDLTGYDITAQARSDYMAAGALNAVVEGRDDPNGTFTLRWPGDAVRTLLGSATSWVGVWDLQIKKALDTDATTVVAGKFSATMDITRPGEALSARYVEPAMAPPDLTTAFGPIP